MPGRHSNCKIGGVEEGCRDITRILQVKIILYIELVIVVKAVAEGIGIDNKGYC